MIDSIRHGSHGGSPQQELVAFSRSEYRELLGKLADGYPWIGTPPYESSLSSKTARSAYASSGFRRRVLVSWIIGRPVSEVAKRAGCSVRTVYNVLEAVLLQPDLFSPLASWAELGLVAVADGPAIEFGPSGGDRLMPAGDQELPVICLVCHRVAAKVDWHIDQDLRRYDGSIILPGDERWNKAAGAVVASQGHLLCHFHLGDDPVRMKPRMKWQHFAGAFAPERLASARELDRQEAHREPWTYMLNDAVLAEFNEWREAGARPLFPVRGGREMRDEEAVRFWSRVFKGQAA
jgi:hypothetical protein